ncbi:universal stress protein [Tabrizicola sp.]|jgi:nucleotide-binding universal stress UspA family protein|uniref:universal stress protein n=1 Tax=Tabrizicola sp. TaxID=2005166 RepID=UPI000BD0D0EC|nr:universal stress protein [Tabrizicola sp.]MBY0352437.1 universal stress protein [Tabrizicola sp.]MDK2773949.1 universal stress protein [Tabrizicola sp.]OYX21436.1 MAG: universal stress protein [Rhodobacterales bacterium 32-66-9]
MAYKSLLTVATSSEGVPGTVTAAAGIAQKLDAHLDCLALGVDRTQIGYSYVGAGAVVIAAAMERAEVEAREAEAALNAALGAQELPLRSSVESVVTQLGALTDVVAARARYADLVVLPLPYGKARGVEDEAVTEAALFEGMAPVLIVPPSGMKTIEPRRIIVAWNQTREALVAARRAMPFLRQAEMVQIVVIDPPTHGAERSDPGGLLCQLLVRHGVRAEVSVLAKTLPRVSEVLARQARDLDAELLVMGAYGHSRFREAILGGTTRDMLEHAEVPVFLAH